MYVYIYIYTHVFVYMYAYIYIYIHTHIYIYIYIHIVDVTYIICVLYYSISSYIQYIIVYRERKREIYIDMCIHIYIYRERERDTLYRICARVRHLAWMLHLIINIDTCPWTPYYNMT